MSDFMKFAFAAGVMAPVLRGRSDLEKFDLGLAEGMNWFIDYRGGVSTRAGTQFLEYLKNDDEVIRIVRFKFNAEIANTYLIIFGRDYIRFAQDGSYVLEDAISLDSIVGDSPAVVTATGHGYSDGDWVRLSGGTINTPYTILVSGASANTFTAMRIDGMPITPFEPGLFASVIYEIPSPFVPEDLFSLSFEQAQNEIVITSTKYPVMRLVRNDTTDWVLSEIDFGTDGFGPSAVTTTPEAVGTSGALFGVTAVSLDGVESVLSEYAIEELSVNYTSTLGSLLVEWSPVPDTQVYNVYRSLFANKGEDITLGYDLGLLGSSTTTSFIDTNIIPDFTQSPPRHFDPFANGTVLHVNVTAPGSGYGKDDTTVSVAGGTGFIGHAVVNTGGEVQSVIVQNGGENFTSGSVVSFGGTGAGATGSVITSPASGNYPRTSITNQQRRVYAGTTNSPMTLFGSRSGEVDSFDLGQQQTPAGPYFLTVDSDEQTPIKYLAPVSNGYFVFTESDVWQARGQDDTAVTADTATISPTTETGIADVPPLKIEREVVYVETQSASVRTLRPSNLPTYFVDHDLSLFSSHFFGNENQVTSWTYAKDPYRVVWVTRQDGSALSFTYVPDQNVYAWCDQYTNGEFLDVESVRENNVDQVYFVVQRGTRKFLEALAPRRNTTVETMWAVDSGLMLGPTQFTGALQVSDVVGDVTLEGFDFAPYVGQHLRCNSGRILITGASSGSVELKLTDVNKNTDLPLPVTSWSIGALFESASGLDHLEGRTVQILGDGNELQTQTVVNGTIQFESPVSLAIAGLGFDADLVTLPLNASDTVIENKPKNVTAVAVRLHDSRGMWAGADESNVLYEHKERTTERYGIPIMLENGMHEIAVRSGWEKDGSIRIEKRGPFNMTVLGLVVEAEVGDG